MAKAIHFETKVKTTIRINRNLLEKAQEYGLNLSKTVEDTLKMRIQALEQARLKEQTVFGEAFSAEKGSKSLERASIPRPTAYKAVALPS